MFAVQCQIHHKEYLVGFRSLRDLENGEHGPIGLIDLPCGHTVAHSFRHEHSVPVPA